VLKLFGGSFHIYNPQGEVVFFASMKAFKLKEDIRLYSGEDMQQELLVIQARQILDFSAAYDVVDPATHQKVGALRRKGLKSIIRDEWQVLDQNDMQIGLIQEDSTVLALVRRFLTNLVPQSYQVLMNGVVVAHLKQNFNPFVFKLTLDFSADHARALDKRLGIAAGLLLAAIEGRQG
jgi:uncharacterized protein YxjI